MKFESIIYNKPNTLPALLLKRKKTVKRTVTIALILFTIYIFGFGDYGIYQYYKLRKVESQLITELSQLEAEAGELKKNMELLTNRDSDYIQRVAREKYGLVQPGEKIYIITPSSQSRNH